MAEACLFPTFQLVAYRRGRLDMAGTIDAPGHGFDLAKERHFRRIERFEICRCVSRKIGNRVRKVFGAMPPFSPVRADGDGYCFMFSI